MLDSLYKALNARQEAAIEKRMEKASQEVKEVSGKNKEKYASEIAAGQKQTQGTQQRQITIQKQKQITRQAERAVQKQSGKSYQLTYVSAVSRMMQGSRSASASAYNNILRKFEAQVSPMKGRSKEENIVTQINRVREVQREQAREVLREQSMLRERQIEKQAELEVSKTRQRQTTKTAELGKTREIKVLIPKRFNASIEKYRRNKNRRGDYRWDINNPVSTLKSLLG